MHKIIIDLLVNWMRTHGFTDIRTETYDGNLWIDNYRPDITAQKETEKGKKLVCIEIVNKNLSINFFKAIQACSNLNKTAEFYIATSNKNFSKLSKYKGQLREKIKIDDTPKYISLTNCSKIW